MEAFDAFAWARQVAGELENEFGERLVFVGLQGSRARGEAHEGSDIDLVVVLDRLDARDLARYRGIIARQPHARSSSTCFSPGRSAFSQPAASRRRPTRIIPKRNEARSPERASSFRKRADAPLRLFASA